jgi:hypothetical protein
MFLTGRKWNGFYAHVEVIYFPVDVCGTYWRSRTIVTGQQKHSLICQSFQNWADNLSAWHGNSRKKYGWDIKELRNAESCICLTAVCWHLADTQIGRQCYSFVFILGLRESLSCTIRFFVHSTQNVMRQSWAILRFCCLLTARLWLPDSYQTGLQLGMAALMGLRSSYSRLWNKTTRT